MQQHGWARKVRTLALGGSAVLGVTIAGLATTMSASAHYIIGTTPQPAVGVVNTTALADQATVFADSSRHVVFFLWGPQTCGVQGATPVFTDSEPVTTPSLTDSTVTSGTFVPQSTGTFEWTAEIVINSGGAIESGPTACGDEPVTVNKIPTSIDTTPSHAKRGTHRHGADRFGDRSWVQPHRKRAVLSLRPGQHDLQFRSVLRRRSRTAGSSWQDRLRSSTARRAFPHPGT